MSAFEDLPAGVVSLDHHTGCTMQRAGHVPNPVQARLHHTQGGITGTLELRAGVVVLISEHGVHELHNHDRSRFTTWAEQHAGARVRLAAHMIRLAEGPSPSISVAIGRDELGICRPSWASSARRVWRLGQPRRGGPVRHQHVLLDLGWGGVGSGLEGTIHDEAPLGVHPRHGRADRRSGWSRGLAAKLLDLSTRGPHRVELATPSGSLAYRIDVDDAWVDVTLGSGRDPGRPAPEPGRVPLLAVATACDLVWAGFSALDGHPPIEVDITPWGDRP